MSRERRKKSVIPRSRKAQPDPYTAKIRKPPSKRELEDTLRHAVSHRDTNSLEDYDENPRPPTNAVKAEETGEASVHEVVDDEPFDWTDRDYLDEYDPWGEDY